MSVPGRLLRRAALRAEPRPGRHDDSQPEHVPGACCLCPHSGQNFAPCVSCPHCEQTSCFCVVTSTSAACAAPTSRAARRLVDQAVSARRLDLGGQIRRAVQAQPAVDGEALDQNRRAAAQPPAADPVSDLDPRRRAPGRAMAARRVGRPARQGPIPDRRRPCGMAGGRALTEDFPGVSPMPRYAAGHGFVDDRPVQPAAHHPPRRPNHRRTTPRTLRCDAGRASAAGRAGPPAPWRHRSSAPLRPRRRDDGYNRVRGRAGARLEACGSAGACLLRAVRAPAGRGPVRGDASRRSSEDLPAAPRRPTTDRTVVAFARRVETHLLAHGMLQSALCCERR